MGIGDKLAAIAALSAVESYLLQRTVLPDQAFRSLALWTFWSNIGLRVLYDIVIYPYFLNPLRHLPRVQVSLDVPPGLFAAADSVV
jgi:hypothetical protein